MKATHMDRINMYASLAKKCSSNCDGTDCWQSQTGFRCPFEREDEGEALCQSITPEDWRKIFEDEEAPQFQFGDKVTVEGIRAVFVFCGKTLADTAEVIFERSYTTTTVAMHKIKAGWL